MTKAELLTDLSSKPDVLDTNTPILVEQAENINKYDVPIVLDKGNDLVVGASQPILVIDEGQAGESAYYNAKKVFTEAPSRSQLYTDTQYINGIESNFTGWKVLSLSVTIDEGADVPTDTLDVKASDGSNIVQKKIDVWNESGSPQYKVYA